MGFNAEFLLQAAADYPAMFKGLLAVDPKAKPQVDNAIGWARRFLKKQDRIVWFLRWVRTDLATSLRQTSDFEANNPDIKRHTELDPAVFAFLKSILRDLKRLGYHDTVDLKTDLEHYLSLPIPEIQNRVFGNESPDELFGEFSKHEQEFKEARRGLLLPRPEDKIILQFPDGWAWWQLPRASCQDEASAMGHCGNSPQADNPNQNILSLRQPRKVGNTTWWEPHATAIYNLNGYIGEFKGKQNNKPVTRLHPYIVALLKLRKV